MGKVEPDFRLDLYLVEIFVDHFDGVFDRRNVDFGGGEDVECAVECRRFSASGWTCDEDESVFGGDHASEGGDLFFCHAETVDALEEAVGVEDADDHFFAEGDGHSRDAEFDFSAVVFRFDASVLGASFFGDVHASQGFESRDDGGVDDDGEFVDGV